MFICISHASSNHVTTLSHSPANVHSHLLHAKQSNATADEILTASLPLARHPCHTHGNQRPSARSNTPPPATNSNRGNVKNHQMRQTSNYIEAMSRITRRDNLRRHGNLPYICASRTRTHVEDNCLISIVQFTTSMSSAHQRRTASRHD